MQMRRDKSIAEIENHFNIAIAEISDESLVLKSEFTHSSALNFREYLEQAKTRTVADFESGKIDYNDAEGFAKSSEILAQHVARCKVTTKHITEFVDAVKLPMKKSLYIGQIVGGIIGAVLGVALGAFLGVMIGAGMGPGAAATALIGGAQGAITGATIGATLGGAIFGYLGSKFTLWRHPLSGMANAAKKVAEKSETSSSIHPATQRFLQHHMATNTVSPVTVRFLKSQGYSG